MREDVRPDEEYLKRCFELASKGKGIVSPNPLVGAVIVKDGKVIGEGYHRKYGEAHAEVDAFNNSSEDPKGSTLYSNLEPCCHAKKQTPPCVPLIISNKISRVVISNLDPNPEVSGEGIKQLREAGIEVITELLKDEGDELNKFYFSFTNNKIPYITLKAAQSEDGKISKSNSEQTWLTGKESIHFVHKQRAVFDAVLIGANTVKVDNPQLNVRFGEGRNPKRIILDGKLSIDLNSKVLNCEDAEKTFVLTNENSKKEKIEKIIDKGAKVFQFETDVDGKISLKNILTKLGEKKITSLFIEGGADVFSQFIEEDFFDEIIILQAPVTLGEGVNGISTSSLNHIKEINNEKLGGDLRLVYRKIK